MLTTEQFYQILKTRKFKSKVEGLTDSYVFTFTAIYILRDDKPLCQYEIVKENGRFKFIFSNKSQNFFSDNFKNVLFVVSGDDNFPLIVNLDTTELQSGEGLDIFLEAQ